MRKGFTLLELLTVMAIMAIVSTIATMGYFAIMRGSASRGVVEHMTQMLSLARQTAIMQGKKVYVIFDQDRTNSWYAVCRVEGVADSGSSGQWLYDDYADWSDMQSNKVLNATIYNLTTLHSGTVKESKPDGLRAEASNGGGMFSEGDIYGWAVYPVISLARGMQYGKTINDKPFPVIFNPDGSCQNGGGIEIYEKINLGKAFCAITINSGTGLLTVDMDP